MEIEEAVTIKIEDDGTTEMSGDVVIELNTMNTGTAKFLTNELSGCFESMILSSDKPVEIDISSELGYSIYHVRDYVGTTYICIRTQNWDELGHQVGFSVSPFHLNEKLLITVQGQNNTNVKFILRLED